MAEQLTCEWCQWEFDRPHEAGPAPKFCGAGHRQRAFEARRIATAFDVPYEMVVTTMRGKK